MKGTLQDFRVAEILQLVAVQQKTGLLRVQGRSTTLTFYFDKGVLVSCRDRRRMVADPLLDYLRHTGWLDPSLARQLESELEGTSDDLADLLLTRQLLSEEELDGTILDLAQELITSSYSWNEGNYLFIAGEEALMGLKHRMSRNVEGLLMEAARRADEWPRLLEKIPGPETVVGGLTQIPDGLDATTRGILERLAQPITMHELAAQARIPEFEVYETVSQAIESNIARVLEKPRQPSVPRGAQQTSTKDVAPTKLEKSKIPLVIPRRRLALGTHAVRMLTWLLAILVCTGCLAGVIALSEHRLAQPPAQLEQQRDTARSRIERDLEIYRAVFGQYPAALEDLVAAELTDAPLLERAAVDSFRRTSGGRSYRIAYARPEGQ